MFSSALLMLCLANAASAAPLNHEDFLPPLPEWHGASESLMLEATHSWATDFERSGGRESPDYAATRAWLRRLVDASDQLGWISLGLSPEQREIFAVVASNEGALTLEQLQASDRPVVFAQAGIHSGEIDGKDAGMMLLRDMTVLGVRAGLLDRVNFVFVPIFSVDAHERRSRSNRINQRGPLVQGWRTTARNLNLNRDYTKADAVEMQHMLRFLHALDPDLYIDVHVTDGADYGYDITYGFNGPTGWSPQIATWLGEELRPAVDDYLEGMGHIPGPLIFTVDQLDVRKGMDGWMAPPRFSHGYGDACHIPSILVENHSLKPYRQRVLGTYIFLEGCLRAVGRGAPELRAARAADRAARPELEHLDYELTDPGEVDFLAMGEAPYLSAVSGDTVMAWTGEVEEIHIPQANETHRKDLVRRPPAYWIPAAWSDLGDVLRLHGIRFERLSAPRTVDVDQLRLPDAKIADEAFEGRVRVESGEAVVEPASVRFGPGALRVSTDQPGGTLAVLLLDPRSPDSFFQWGSMLEILQETEYFESYVIAPMAERMLAEDPQLAAEFAARLAADEKFAADPDARLRFFYERTPFYDREFKLYPVALER